MTGLDQGTEHGVGEEDALRGEANALPVVFEESAIHEAVDFESTKGIEIETGPGESIDCGPAEARGS